MAAALDEQSGERKSQGGAAFGKGGYGGTVGLNRDDRRDIGYGDSGGASKYFLTAGYEPWELEWIYSVGLRPCGTD